MELKNQESLRILSEKIGMPVISLVYSADNEIETDHVTVIIKALKGIKPGRVCLMLHGDGGHFDPALDLAVFLRDRFNKKLVTVIPEKAASAKAYIVLLSNKALFHDKAYLTQFDIVFKHGFNEYRPSQALKHKDKSIRDDGKFIWGMSFDLLENILSRKDSLCKKKKLDACYITKVMDVCMRKTKGHPSPIRFAELQKLDLNVDIIDPEQGLLFEQIKENSLKELKKKNKIFVLESSEHSIYF